MKYIDLFCGIGGFRIAMDSLGHECVFSSDWDVESQKVYKNNFNELPEGDITKIDAKYIPKHDILCAGFPCQAFSISGKQLGFEDTRGTLFHDIARIAKYHQPKYIFLENVQNFEKHDRGKTIKTVIQILNRINYTVFYSVLNASFYGVPQSRKRIYFIAVRKDNGNISFQFPAPNFKEITLQDILLSETDTKHLRIKRNDIVIENRKVIFDSVLKHLTPIRIGYVNKGGQGERIYHPLGHAITLSAYGGGAGAKTGLYLIHGHVRKLHPEECKRLMTFPDNFKIHLNPNQAYKQFGNSVVVSIVKQIFRTVMEVLECDTRKKIPILETKLNDYIAV